MHPFRILLFTCGLLAPVLVQAQKNLTQLSPSLLRRGKAWQQDSIHFTRFILDTRSALPPDGPSATAKGNGIYIVRATPYSLLQWVKRIDGQVFVDEQLAPHTEAGVINYDMTLNGVTAAWNRFPFIDGRGEVLSIQENRPDSSDLDMLGKRRQPGTPSPVLDNHATIMATLAIGSGNSSFRGKGVAHRAAFSSTDFIDVLPSPPSYYRNGGIHVQNHSYGTGIQNYYGVNARAFDLSVNADSTLLHVFSSGNSGTSTSGQGAYASVPKMANITGNMKQAKNILLAGAMLEDGSVPAYSSRGPLYDGRIAPHVVAMGDDGTSGSAAIVSGTALLLQQQFKNRYGRPAPSYLLRSVLVNSARDMGAEGPDYTTGFGALDAEASLATIHDGRVITGSINPSAINEYDITVPAGSRSVKVTLAWNDSAAASGAALALINDLDLALVNRNSGEVLQPWGLSVFPLADSLNKPARRMKDAMNNIEQVSLRMPAAGTYTIRVTATSTTTPTFFGISYSVDKDDELRWDFPGSTDKIAANEPIRLRWKSTVPTATGRLEMSRDKGQNWQLLKADLDLAAGSFPITMPDSILEVRYRISIPGRSFETADVISSPSLVTSFGYVCDTFLLAYWNRIRGASSYTVYRLDADTMRGFALVPDSFSLSRTNGTSYFAVAGMLNGKEGVRGFAVDHRKQNIGCYINNFLATLRDNKADLNLALGSLFQVRRVEIYKTSDKNRTLLSVNKPTVKDFAAVDETLHQGVNKYQAKVVLEDGSERYSDEEVVYFMNNKSHILFPNPVVQGSPLYLLTEGMDDEDADIYDMQGKHLLHVTVKEKLQELPVSRLSKGTYVLRISSASKTVQRLQFVVR